MADKKQLPSRQEIFCQEYVKEPHATKAGIAAGYSEKTAHAQACRLLKKVHIQKRISELKTRQFKRIEVQADDVLRELMRIGYSDIRSILDEGGCVKDPALWPDDIARCIASIEVVENYEGHGNDRAFTGYTKKIKLWNKNQALDLLAKHKNLTNLFKHEHSGPDGEPIKTVTEPTGVISRRIEELLAKRGKK